MEQLNPKHKKPDDFENSASLWPPAARAENDWACAKFEFCDGEFYKACLFQNIESGFYFSAETLSFPKITIQHKGAVYIPT